MILALGGSVGPIHSDGERHNDPELHGQISHEVILTANGRLRSLYDTDSGKVNSIHRQANDSVGCGLVIEAKSPSEVVQAISSERADEFMSGVQWHPEWGVDDGLSGMALFRTFVSAGRLHD